MDVINILKKKTKRQEVPNHPLGTLSVEVRYTYGFGLAVLAMGNMKVIDELKEPFLEQCLSLKLPDAMIVNYMSDINNHFNRKMDEFLTLLEREERFKYCFYIDMLTLVYAADWGKQYAVKVYHQYVTLLRLSEYETNFLKRFLTTKKEDNLDHAKTLYHDFVAKGHYIDFMILKYMNPDFQLKEQLYTMHLENGGVHIIGKETVVEGDIYVTNGTKLIINNAKLCITGSIYVEDGRLDMIDSEIIAIADENTKEKEKESLIKVSKVHRIRAERTTFLGNFIRTIITQNEGELALTDCQILSCKEGRAITFSGERMIIEDCQFRECFGGGIGIQGDVNCLIKDSLFVKCEADHGGGVHSDNSGTTKVEGCAFIDCAAGFLGAAIYFPYKKLGQIVEKTELIDPVPVDTAVFNAYEYKE